MASRKEQKERARQERQAAERAAAERARRSRRIRHGIGGAAALAAMVIVVLVVTGGTGATPPVPAQLTTDLSQAAAAAGCQTKASPFDNNADRKHVPDGTKVSYKTNPPSFGPHYATPAPDGAYVGRSSPVIGALLHALEHSRVEIQYRPGLAARQVGQLQTLFNQSAGQYGAGQYELLFQNTTAMPYAIAVTAWAHSLTCPTFNPRVFDAIRAFRIAYTLKGPELVTQPE
ncbi:MAG: DUF3105 domain-containing protein [Solirubrobacteraceae bacterium]